MRVKALSLVIALLASSASAETLNEALSLAYSHAPALQAERAALDATHEGYNQARAGYLPSVTASGTIGRTETDDGVTPETVEPKTASLTAVQPLFRGGRTVAGVDQARALIDAHRARLRLVEQQVLLDTISTYMDVRRDQDALAIRQSNLEALSRQREAAEIRFKVGEITKTDVAQAEARLAGARAAYSAAEAQLAVSRAAYKALVGQMPGTLEAPGSSTFKVDGLDAAVATALGNSPSMKAALAAEVAARKAVSIARAAGLPSLSVQASASTAQDSLFDGSELDSTSLVASASIPLYAGGSISSGVRAALANQNKAKIEVEYTRRAVEATVTAAWHALQAAQVTLEARQAQEEASAFAFKGVEQEAQVGLRTTLDVLDAQQEYLEAQLAVISAERDLIVRQNGLRAAMGGLTPEALGLDVKPYDAEAAFRASRRAIGR